MFFLPACFRAAAGGTTAPAAAVFPFPAKVTDTGDTAESHKTDNNKINHSAPLQLSQQPLCRTGSLV